MHLPIASYVCPSVHLCTVAFWHVVKLYISLVSLIYCVHENSFKGKIPVLVTQFRIFFFINAPDTVTENKLLVQQACRFFLCPLNRPTQKSLLQKIWAIFVIFYWILTCVPRRRRSLHHGRLCSLSFALATPEVAGLACPQAPYLTIGWEILGGCPHHLQQEVKTQCKG